MARFPRLNLPRFLRRAAPAPQIPRDSVENWAAGDLAECVVALIWCDQRGQDVPGPKQGSVTLVIGVRISKVHPLAGTQLLYFSRFPGYGYDARCFRKITPCADEAERADAEFIASLKPARVREPAAGALRP